MNFFAYAAAGVVPEDDIQVLSNPMADYSEPLESHTNVPHNTVAVNPLVSAPGTVTIHDAVIAQQRDIIVKQREVIEQQRDVIEQQQDIIATMTHNTHATFQSNADVLAEQPLEETHTMLQSLTITVRYNCDSIERTDCNAFCQEFLADMPKDMPKRIVRGIVKSTLEWLEDELCALGV
jgi:hypothetical protein